MNAIAIRGFVSGYMEKTAQPVGPRPTSRGGDTWDPAGGVSYGPEQPEQGSVPLSAMPAAARGEVSGGGVRSTGLPAGAPTKTKGAPEMGARSQNLHNLRRLLTEWVAPAAAGAAVVGGASVGIDALRRRKREAKGKPAIDIKRAVLLSVALGVPLGIAVQMVSTGTGRAQLASAGTGTKNMVSGLMQKMRSKGVEAKKPTPSAAPAGGATVPPSLHPENEEKAPV